MRPIYRSFCHTGNTRTRAMTPAAATHDGCRCSVSSSGNDATARHIMIGQRLPAHGLTLHKYADDCQICIITSVSDAPASVRRFARCIDDVAAWMSASLLRLNPTKIEVLWLGSQVPSGHDRHSACAGSVNLSQSGQHCSRPWRLHRQITDNV